MLVAGVLVSLVVAGQGKYTVKVPGGLAFSEFRGYEDWQTIGISRSGKAVAVILGNPAMINAYRAGIPTNGRPVPDGAKMAKAHWAPKQNEFFATATVPGSLLNVDFMVKDSKRCSLPSSRTRWSKTGGYSPQEAKRVAETLLPEILFYDPGRPASYPANGRALSDDVMDVFISLLTNGKLTRDGVEPHQDLLAEFPYLGPPHKSM